MARKKWRHDGPQLSSQPWWYSPAAAARISQMSHEADAERRDLELVRTFLQQQRPDLKREAFEGRLARGRHASVYDRVLDLARDHRDTLEHQRLRRREIALRHARSR